MLTMKTWGSGGVSLFAAGSNVPCIQPRTHQTDLSGHLPASPINSMSGWPRTTARTSRHAFCASSIYRTSTCRN